MPREAAVPPSVKSYALGNGTRLLRVVVNDSMAGVTVRKPTPVLVLDRSGSMGNWCRLAVARCVPAALLQAGYDPEDRVVVITFDSVIDRVMSPVVSATRRKQHTRTGVVFTRAIRMRHAIRPCESSRR